VAAHELKTPITGLRGFAQLTIRRIDRDGALDPTVLRQMLSSIDEQSKKLTRLVAQLLDVSRIEAGKLTLERSVTDVTLLTEHVVASMQATTDRHAISVDAPTPVVALVDALRLEHVIANLLDNAIKYSPAGGAIEVQVTAPAATSIRLTVRDYGLGVPLAHRPRIFDRFYQAHGDGYLGGMGLGLYISRSIVDLHGGDLTAEFPPDGGARFIITMPVEAVSPRRNQAHG
jgi:signal transduction histidine kinase